MRPGDTPPESGQTSGLSHKEPEPPKATTTRIIVALILLVAVLVAAMVLTQAFLLG